MTNELEAGPELDALIADKVMCMVPCENWFVQRYTELGPIWFGGAANCGHGALHYCYPKGSPAKYSTNMEAAWTVLEKLSADKWRAIHIGNTDSGWNVQIDRSERALDSACDSSPTAPLAICRAALKAIEEKT